MHGENGFVGVKARRGTSSLMELTFLKLASFRHCHLYMASHYKQKTNEFLIINYSKRKTY